MVTVFSGLYETLIHLSKYYNGNLLYAEEQRGAKGITYVKA